MIQIVINAAKLKAEGRDITSLISALKTPAETAAVRLKLTSEDFAELGSRVLEDMEKWVRETSGLELVTPNFDGVRVSFTVPVSGGGKQASGWFLMRKSLHEPVLPLNIEADTEGGTEAVLSRIYDFVSRYEGVEIPG